MAVTSFARSDALTVEAWARVLEHEVTYRTDIGAITSTSPNSIVHLKTEIKEVGDRVTFPLMKRLTGDGFTENEVAEGNGEALSLYSDSIIINEMGHVVGVKNPERSIDGQRTLINCRQEARYGLRDWYKERMSVIFFNQVCGNTTVTDPKYTGFNAITAPTRTARLNTDSGYAVVANDEALASGDEFTLEHLDIAKEIARTNASPVRPINVTAGPGGQDISGDKYVAYIHPIQATQLRINSGSRWFDINKAGLQGGDISKNAIYTGALGEYNNIIIKEANHVTTGVNSSTGAALPNVRRAVLLGAQAVAKAHGKIGGPSSYNWNEEKFDHKRNMEVSVMTICGMKKVVFGGQDYGVVTIPTYAAAHGVA